MTACVYDCMCLWLHVCMTACVYLCAYVSAYVCRTLINEVK